MVRWASTRNQNQTCSTTEAILQGLGADGGLFVLQGRWPTAEPYDATLDFAANASRILSPFFDAATLDLKRLCEKAFNFPLVFRQIEENTQILELFHGPTLSFKDFGARFLAQCMQALEKDAFKLIMVATSGDTGSAVASAFHRQKGIGVVVLYPALEVSAVQASQLNAFGDNVIALAIEGGFDDCQRLVKEALNSPYWQAKYNINSANSINIARLLAQLSYYADVSLRHQAIVSHPLNVIIPSGNLGHAVAAFYAKKMGYPLGEIVLAVNANEPVWHYHTTGDYHAYPRVNTLANAMDVGQPSNIERLFHLFPTHKLWCEAVRVIQVQDEEIKETIKRIFNQHKEVICPHTAVGFYARAQLGAGENYMVAATAHPAKFNAIIEPIIGRPVEMPSRLRAQVRRARRPSLCAARLEAIERQMGLIFERRGWG